MAGRIRVLLVLVNLLFREALRAIIEAQSDLVVVAEASSSEQAVMLLAHTLPDAVVFYAENLGDGIAQTVRQIIRVRPATRVLVLSTDEDLHQLRESLSPPVQVYPVQSTAWSDLVAALRSGTDIHDRSGSPRRTPPQQPAPFSSDNVLSQRERQVLMLVAKAFSNAQIARRLDIVEGTVKRHLRNIFVKLGATSRLDAVNKAVAASMIAPSAKPATRSLTRLKGGVGPSARQAQFHDWRSQ
jgi:DNA-binding NarL/FixJ family response regulator